MPLQNPSRHFCPSLPLDPYLHAAVHRIKLLRLTLPDPVAAAAKPRPHSPPLTFPWRGGARSSSTRSCPPRPASAAPPSVVAGEARGEEMALYLLFQAATGYALFHAYDIGEIGRRRPLLRAGPQALQQGRQAGRFTPFSFAKDTLDQQNAKVKEGKKAKYLILSWDHDRRAEELPGAQPAQGEGGEEGQVQRRRHRAQGRLPHHGGHRNPLPVERVRPGALALC